ncbi:hypothetical protein [Brevibacillus sp. AY1]|uniref:hypothetical protein n=1 Tax=Brevibacillus sp. AY1 TaxID=2807621 RepID=UPI002453D28E|nr:hypothetical protein [Brevibacillus sp. AY1]MDH4617219.1 hypothetical protein [Brevibacillus sp. AY1]
MSLKAVELQVAIPRMTEVGRIQEQQLQRPTHEQVLLHDERKQLDEHNRQRPIDVEHTEKGMIREREQKQKKKDEPAAILTTTGSDSTTEEKTAEAVDMRDPLRGRFIDISL